VLLLSIVSLFIGPLLYLWLRRGGFVAKAFDSLIVVVLIVLMAFMLIPESWAELGYGSIVLMVGGYLLPGVLENLLEKAARTLHRISLLLALAGLALHAMIDGAALGVGPGGMGNSLSVAIVLHRFGVGLLLWLMVQPIYGRRVAFAILGFVGLATVGGYLLSQTILGIQSHAAMSLLQALVIGMIVHSLVHRNHGGSHSH